jgi:hypothetical protein
MSRFPFDRCQINSKHQQYHLNYVQYLLCRLFTDDDWYLLSLSIESNFKHKMYAVQWNTKVFMLLNGLRLSFENNRSMNVVLAINMIQSVSPIDSKTSHHIPVCTCQVWSTCQIHTYHCLICIVVHPDELVRLKVDEMMHSILKIMDHTWSCWSNSVARFFTIHYQMSTVSICIYNSIIVSVQSEISTAF